MTSIRTFVTDVPAPLLAQFFERHTLSIPKETFAGKPVDVARAVESQLKEAPPGARGKLDADIEAINQLATPEGEIAVEEGSAHIPAELPSSRARSLWLFLNETQDFKHADDILYSNVRRGGREWSAFIGAANAELATSEDARNAFADAVRKFFNCENVHIEVFRRIGPSMREVDEPGADDDEPDAYQIMIYREVLPQSERQFENGTLVMKKRKPVVEAALTFEPKSGIVECVTGQFKVREGIVRSFVSTMLGAEVEFELKPLPAYSLEVLRERQSFSHDPEDKIASVRVSCLRLCAVEATTTRITVECEGRDGRDIWSEVEERLGPQALQSDYVIKHARLLIQYNGPGIRPVRRLIVSLTPPYRSSLREKSDFERKIASRYLPRWGLMQP